MTPERHRQVSELFHAALALAPGSRPAFLTAACTDDESLRREVESLLAHESDAKGFLSTPAAAIADTVTSHGQSMMGRQVGPYAIHARLGAGGMGEVYRARDTTLGRDVAIKILPRIFSTDPERRARFDREARLLASLNHPHIGAIYGVEDMDGTPALILELVDGDTLAERLARSEDRALHDPGRGRPSGRPFSITEALNIAQQIADALEAAHEKGVIHRDLKPANIKITPDGIVKVLDFGLAKAASGDASGPDLTQSPTLSVGGTRDGVILGTAPYMSPEQARGKPVDKRADIWAFGCVLYEMLTGHAPFVGETFSDTLAAILEREPNWQALPAATPDKVRDVLWRCLQKDPHRRLRDIGDAHLDIDDAIAAPAPAPADVGTTPRRNPRERLWWVAALVALVAAAVSGIAWSLRRPQVWADEARLEINTPPTTEPASLAISPDGKTLVFVATTDGKSRLWLRPLGDVSARPLTGTENAKSPFWSPDSRSVGFSADGQLKRIDLDNGSVRMLTHYAGFVAGAWNRDGTILLSQLLRVSADGGDPTPATPITGWAEQAWFPQFLPDHRHFLFYANGPPPGIFVGQLGAPDAPRRILDAQAATFASSGHLFFVRQGTLYAQAFDPVRQELGGTPTAVTEQIVLSEVPGGAALSASAAGPIVYRTGGSGTQSIFVWFDRSGNVLETVAGSDIEGGFNSSLSPDGRRLAIHRLTGGNVDIWLLDTNRGVSSRFTFDPAFDGFPVWSPNGRRIAFNSDRKEGGLFGLYVKPAVGNGTEDLLLATPRAQRPSDWSPDGRFILMSNDGEDIWALPLDGDRKPFPVVETKFVETNGQFSPDGKWIAFQSTESGRVEIYVQRFPGPGRKQVISSDGGDQARWRHDGKELFYLALDNRLMAVPIGLDSDRDTVDVGTPVALFAPHLGGVPRNRVSRHYMVSPDGQRFLMDTLKEVTLPITVILNWKPRP